MNPLYDRFRSENGQALILLPILFVILSVMAGLSVDVGYEYLTQLRLQNALDAGALAVSQSLSNGDSSSMIAAYANSFMKANGFSSVTFDPANNTGDDRILIDSSTETVKLTVTQPTPTFFMPVIGIQNVNITASSTAQDNGSSPVFDYALFGNQNLQVSGNYITVNGSAHSNGNMKESGNYESVTDNLEVSGTYSASGNHISEGDLVKNAPLVPMPVIDMNTFKAKATTVYNNGLNLSGNSFSISGLVFVNGNVNISGNYYTGTGTIVATGSINISGNGMIQQNPGQGLLALYSGGNINVSGNSTEIDGILYAPNTQSGQISISGNYLTVKGAVIGQNITVSGNYISVTYDASAAKQSVGGKPKLIN